MTISVFIDGAAGTTGLEIAERLAGRSEFSLIALDDGDFVVLERQGAAVDCEVQHLADPVTLRCDGLTLR